MRDRSLMTIRSNAVTRLDSTRQHHENRRIILTHAELTERLEKISLEFLMSSPQTARQILDRHYLEIRSKILDLAASLDRLDRTDDAKSLQDDPRLAKLRSGIELLLMPGNDRAERVQMLFSDAYVENWMKQ